MTPAGTSTSLTSRKNGKKAQHTSVYTVVPDNEIQSSTPGTVIFIFIFIVVVSNPTVQSDNRTAKFSAGTAVAEYHGTESGGRLKVFTWFVMLIASPCGRDVGVLGVGGLERRLTDR